MALARDASEWLPAVLLVDDDPEFLRELRAQLERLTRDVYVAQSPLEALWLLQHVELDAIVCDLFLGAADGLCLLEQLRTERPDVVRVLLTGFGDAAAGHPGLQVAQAILHKPVSAACLADLLRRLVAHRSLAEINESSDLSALSESGGPIVLNLEHVRTINSAGARKLMLFAENVGSERALIAERCSPVVVGQLNLLPLLARRLCVRSVIAPLECAECLTQRDVIVDVSAGRRPDLPQLDCERCGAPMELADLPERYFAFLELP
ncbi:MAG TPA: response regulator [Kofleriaceae bacterium]|nr:response regulator [Kofleriaceae bacterium]